MRKRISGTRIPEVFLKNTTLKQFLKLYPHLKDREDELRELQRILKKG